MQYIVIDDKVFSSGFLNQTKTQCNLCKKKLCLSIRVTSLYSLSKLSGTESFLKKIFVKTFNTYIGICLAVFLQNDKQITCIELHSLLWNIRAIITKAQSRTHTQCT